MSPVLAVAGLVVDVEAGTVGWVRFQTPAWDALLEWLRFHQIDPMKVPAGTPITRDAPGRCIRYVRVVEDEHGKPVVRYFRDDDGCAGSELVSVPAVEQGEAPPLPLPDEVLVLMVPRHEVVR